MYFEPSDLCMTHGPSSLFCPTFVSRGGPSQNRQYSIITVETLGARGDGGCQLTIGQDGVVHGWVHCGAGVGGDGGAL